MITLSVKFPPDERKLLLNTPRIGPAVVARLESMGIDSLGELRRLGVDSIVRSICDGAGNSAWANRRSALLQACHLADREGSRSVPRRPDAGPASCSPCRTYAGPSRAARPAPDGR